MKYFIEDVNIFYLTLYGGIVIGILFDFYRVLRRNYKVVRRISIVFDIICYIPSILLSKRKRKRV